jgi:hypothetical protein
MCTFNVATLTLDFSSIEGSSHFSDVEQDFSDFSDIEEFLPAPSQAEIRFIPVQSSDLNANVNETEFPTVLI